MKLFFDIGNSNIKINFKIDNKDYYVSYKTKQNHTVDSFYNSLPKEIKNSTIEEVSICSVVPSLTEIVSSVFKKYYQIKPWIVRYPMKTSIQIETDAPKNLGTDLIALAIYASTINDNVILVNMGTATTIIHVINKKLKGVVITAGLQIQIDSLISSASQLAEVNLKINNKNLGKNTEASMSIGFLNGHAEMIKGLVNNIDKDATLILSGGLSRKINKLLPDFKYVKEATLEGIKILRSLNEY
ncbi:MAG: type III pantothenate kinase [Mycoplasmatales bacterium]|nr:type III pantothenate kinase [Mycoplasmatales bacterium]